MPCRLKMITKEKLNVYANYKGDLDMWLRTDKDHEKTFMESADWYLIDLLLQDANIINPNLGSENRTAEAERRLRESCENVEVIEEIRRMAERDLGTTLDRLRYLSSGK